MKKVYFSKNKAKLVFAVKAGNSVKNITFSNFGGSYTSTDAVEQKAIESTFYFKEGLVYTLTDPEDLDEDTTVNPEDLDEDVAEDITDIQSAKGYLQTKYNVPHQALRSPDAILKQAELNKVSFPNLQL